MKTAFKNHWPAIISGLTIIVICFVWWINGAELEDAWLYIFSVFIVLLPNFETYSKRKRGEK